MRHISVIKKSVSVLLTAAAVMSAGYFPAEASEEEVYQKLYRALVRGETSFDLGSGISPDDVATAVDRIHAENPEICWFSNCSYRYSTLFFEFTAEPVDGFSTGELSGYYSELEAKANAVAREASKLQGDREKLKYVHDYLVSNCDYDMASKGSSAAKPAHTAYGCLIDHKAVCSGYSKAFQLIAKKLGFECGRVSGNAGESHAWNYVKLDGKYYWVDVTWDDPTYDTSSKPMVADICQKYFLIDDELLYRSRTNDDDNPFVPVCTSLDLYQFTLDGAIYDSFSTDMLSGLIEKHMSEGYVNLMFTSESAYSSCLSFVASSDVWHLQVFSDHPGLSSGGIQYTYDDKLYIVTLVFDKTAAASPSYELPQEVFPEAGDYPAIPDGSGDITDDSEASVPKITAAVTTAASARKETSKQTTKSAAAGAADIDTDPGNSSGGFGWLIPVGIGAAAFIAVIAVVTSVKKKRPAAAAPAQYRAVPPPPGGVRQNAPAARYDPYSAATSEPIYDPDYLARKYQQDYGSKDDDEVIDHCFDDYGGF